MAGDGSCGGNWSVVGVAQKAEVTPERGRQAVDKALARDGA